MASDIFGRRSRLEVEERKAGWGADEGGRLVRGAALTWALGERGEAGAFAGRAGWAAARSWRVSGSRPARAGLKGGPVRSRAGCLGWAEREKRRGVNWARDGLVWCWVELVGSPIFEFEFGFLVPLFIFSFSF